MFKDGLDAPKAASGKNCWLLAMANGASVAGAGKGVLGVSGERVPRARTAVQATSPTITTVAIARPI